MLYALQDEPEKGHRLWVLALGVLIASGVQGGGLYAANAYAPPTKEAPPASEFVEFEQPPPPPPPPPPPEPPPPPPEPPPEPPKPRPKPKPKKRRPKPKPKPVAKAPPKPKPPKTPIVLPGIHTASTSKTGVGAWQVGNTQSGEVSRKARKPVTAPPPVAEKTIVSAPPDCRAPVVKRKVEPKYTRAALRAGVEGTTVFVVTIDARGNVVKVAQRGRKLGFGLDAAAVEALKRWKFRAKTCDGVAERSTKRVPVEFVLED